MTFPKWKSILKYGIWRLNVFKMLIPDHISSHSIRKSLRGTASNMLVPLGDTASVQEILDKLEGCYGNVITVEDFDAAILWWLPKGRWVYCDVCNNLENTLSKAVRTGHINAFAKDNMLWSQFWAGLRNTQLSQATRQKYDNIKDFKLYW